MKPRSREAEGAREEEELEDELLAPPVAYRVSGDVQVRAAELELRVAELERSLKSAEHEVFATRKVLRARSAVRKTSFGGLGALVGSLVGAGIYGVTGQPYAGMLAALAGFVIVFVAMGRGEPPDDKFPPAPPARMF